MRPIFENMDKRPALVCSLSDATEAELIATIRNAIWDGADGFLLHTECMDKEYRNVESLKRILAYCEDKPVLTLDYSWGVGDDTPNAAFLLDTIDAGAGCIDVYADMFDHHDRLCYTDKPEAVKKQMELIEKAHAKGAQVMTSCHLFDFVEPEKVLEMGISLEKRGADIVKFAAQVNNEDELLEAMRLTVMLKRTLKVPFLHIAMGQYGKAHRVLAPTLGSCMVLCVQKYTTRSHKDKPLLRAVRTVYDNLDYKRAREE